MIISTSSAIPLRPRRRSNRRRLLASLLLFALFPLGLSAQDAIRIITKTELNSANWIWSEEPKIPEYSEFDDQTIPNGGKARFPLDRERKTIGIGEIINLKLKEKPGSNVAGDKSKATWTILEGGDWAGFSTKNGEPGPSVGEVVMIGARVVAPKVPADLAPRTVKVRVTTDTTPALTADVVITVVVPSGGLKSRHGGPPPPNADVPSTKQFPPNTKPKPGKPPGSAFVDIHPDDIAAMSFVDVIFEPTNVNFGGSFEGGVYSIEENIASPPLAGTYTPLVGSLFANSTHRTGLNYFKIKAAEAGFDDMLGTYRSARILTAEHTCVWTCGWRWRDKEGALEYNADKATGIGGVSLPDVKQRFWITFRTGEDGYQVQNAKISKFNSSVTRDSGADDYTRDTQNNWKP
jgi:hypothetical protein